MKLKSLINSCITIDFNENISKKNTSILKELAKSFPRELFDIILSLQEGECHERALYLPSGQHIKFILKGKKINISCKESKQPNIQQKFKEMLADVYDELQQENSQSELVNHKADNTQYQINLDQIDRLLEEM